MYHPAQALRASPRAARGKAQHWWATAQTAWRCVGVRGHVGIIIVACITGIAVFALLLAPYDPAKQDYAAIMKTPSTLHFLGTDNLGRDVFSRIVFGAQASVRVGLLAVSPALVLGVLMGAAVRLFRRTSGPRYHCDPRRAARIPEPRPGLGHYSRPGCWHQ